MSVVVENGTLNDQQLEMMKLFANPLPDPYFDQIRRFVVKLMAQQLDAVIEEWENKNEMTAEIYQQLVNQHLRSQTPGKRQ